MRHPRRPVRSAAVFGIVASGAILLGACSSGTPIATAAATTSTAAATTSTPVATGPAGSVASAPGGTGATGATGVPGGTSAPPGSATRGGKCTDLTAAAATAAVGKPTTVAIESSDATSSTCDITIAGDVYPVQISVVTAVDAAHLAEEKSNAADVKELTGVGDQAFTDALGVEALTGTVEIKVTGPGDALKNNDYSVSTALAKAMIAALK
ncbi:hypothetical protein [Nakamurella sp. PAMC28650]|uniref:hypothetical protein n=1 Tax=Nakamurella sp. PAMC28650 TaxID=2762325 RepID=UPI00164DE41D|nr:hypothetical protein [Nakamurella sp. PAMC28650]QNK79866.1 hypothetical protein H7F38_16680 [Nakamurella sp. PAMC28650]